MRRLSYFIPRRCFRWVVKPVLMLFTTAAVGSSLLAMPAGLGVDFAQAKPVTAPKASNQVPDYVCSLYMDQLVGDQLASVTKTSRAITRAEWAELSVRMNLKFTGKTVETLVPRTLAIDSSDLFVNEACNAGLMGLDKKRQFIPTVAVTREQVAVVLDKIMKNAVAAGVIPEKQRYKVVATLNIKDAKQITASALPAVKNAVGNGLMTLAPASATFNPKGQMSVSEALQVVARAKNLVSPVKNPSYRVTSAGKFMVPDAAKSDLSCYVPQGGLTDLSMRFSGTAVANPSLSPRDIHLQVATVIMSNSRFSRADAIATLKVIDQGWNETARKYRFGQDVYIKSGTVMQSRPARPYIQIKSGDVLSIDVHETR